MKRRKIVVERIYEQSGSENAVRLLVDRLWPRGIRRDELSFDDWAKELAPSSELRKWYGHDTTRFDTFSARYRAELAARPVREYLARVTPAADPHPIVLLTASKDLTHSHASVLADYLRTIV
ncbi:DUF488 domain-containing protein [Rhodococcus sp. 24CO]|uniref:DUF488 domain-containing protein n=1 Tax=Rhodococcus sp. 24CO TaxID=3117460 RepID=UPI003D35841D